MELFNVYSLYPIEPVRGKGCYVYDAAGTEYLDLYGGHAVISIGACAARLRAGRAGAGRTSRILLQLGREFASGEVGGETGPHLGLRRLPPFPLQLGGRGQRERPETGVVPHGPVEGARHLEGLPRPHVGSRRRDGQSGDLVALQPHAERGVHPPERHRGDAREARHAGVRGGDRRGHSGRCGHPLPDGRVPARRARRGDRDRDAAGARRNPVGIRPHGPLLRPPGRPASAPT